MPKSRRNPGRTDRRVAAGGSDSGARTVARTGARVYCHCMARKRLTTIRLDPEDAAALARARADGISASELVRRGLRAVAAGYYETDDALEPCEAARANPRWRAWLRERQAFLRLEPRLARRAPGQWVAIHRGKVIDRDADHSALFARVYRDLGGATFFVGRVGAPPEVVDMPGFEVA